MVSKTVIFVFLLAVLAASYAKPHHGKSFQHRGQRQREEQQFRRECENVDQQQGSDSNESDRAPCRLREQDNERRELKKLRILDTSDESQEYRIIKVITSQEESNVERVIKQAPQHISINSSQKSNKHLHGAQVVHNQQRPTGQNRDESSEENNYRAEQNQIHRH